MSSTASTNAQEGTFVITDSFALLSSSPPLLLGCLVALTRHPPPPLLSSLQHAAAQSWISGQSAPLHLSSCIIIRHRQSHTFYCCVGRGLERLVERLFLALPPACISSSLLLFPSVVLFVAINILSIIFHNRRVRPSNRTVVLVDILIATPHIPVSTTYFRIEVTIRNTSTKRSDAVPLRLMLPHLSDTGPRVVAP